MNFMLGKQTIFDVERQRIGFAPSRCSAGEALSARNSKAQTHVEVNGIPDNGGAGDKERKGFRTGLNNTNENADLDKNETEWRNITDPDNNVNLSEAISNATSVTASGDEALGIVWTVAKIGGLIASLAILILILIACIKKHRTIKKLYTTANGAQTASSEIENMEINKPATQIAI